METDIYSFLIDVTNPAFISPEKGTIVAFILVALLFLSFCVSGAEVAYFSLTFKDINFLKSKQLPQYKRIVNLLEQPKSLQASLIIANTLANLSIIIIGNHFLDQLIVLKSYWMMFGAKAAIMILIIIMVGEVLPKTMAAQNNIRFAKDVSLIVEVVYLVFGKLASILVSFSDNLEKRVRQKNATSSLEELNHAIDLTTDEEATPDEKNILKGIIKFGNITVKQVMRTRLDVMGIPHQMDFGSLKKRLVELSYSRLPVYDGSLDSIKGMIHSKDLLEYLDKPDDFDWHGLMRKPFFVHEQKLIEDLMTEFQQKRIHFAIVADEFGGTSGIVTMEDILEEVIGDIRDEFDEEESGNKKLDDMNYLFEGKTMLNDVCKFMRLSPSTFDEVKGESDSLAGLILEVAGEIPQPGTVITVGDFNFTIEQVQKNRIEKVKVTIIMSNSE
ncbi:MAG: gliding motility-associated protein GldE [Chitinophagaceae bacterium]|nr:gliding motility-associated protein GldE [Chitinophagaceae bacterium]